jgi:hypothetical protein
MPTTPDRPDGPEDPAPAVEARRLAARETVPVDRTHHMVPINVRRAVPDGAAERPSERETVALDADLLARRETVRVPNQRRPPAPRSGRPPLLVAAGFATLWAALLSYLPVFAVVGLARTLEGAGGLGGAAKAGMAGWLLGHGVPIGTSIGALSLPPLLLTLLVVWRLNRAGLHVTRAIGARHSGSPRTALFVAGTVGLWYGVLGALGALAIDGPGTDVSASRAAFHLFLIGAVGALSGSLGSTDALMVLARRMPSALRHGLRTGLVAALLILAAGAAFAGLSVAIGGGQAADMIAVYGTGVAGQAGITLVSLAYGANGVVWAAAYILGPGFLLGADSTVRITEVTAGTLPTLPLLAGLPNGPVGAAGAALLAVPVVAAMAAGWLLARRLMRPVAPGRAGAPAAPGPAPSWSLVFGAALTAGPVAGVALGLLCWVSGGSLGDGRLAQIGPVPWQVTLVSALVVAIAASAGAAAARAFRATR